YAQHLALLSFPTRRSSDLQPAQLVRPLEDTAQRHCPAPDHVAGHHPAVARGEGDEVREAPVHVTSRAVRPGRTVDFCPDLEVERSEEHTSELQSLTNLVCR